MKERGESNGTKEESRLEKKISEWVANLSLGEEEEPILYGSPKEKEAVIKEWEAEQDPLRRQTIEDEKKLEWKLRLMRERNRRMDEASQIARELEVMKEQRAQIQAQADIQGKLDIMYRNIELLARAWEEQYQFSRAQDMTLHSIRLGFRDFAHEMMRHVGAEVQARLEGTKKFCTGVTESAKLAVPKEEELRPRRELLKMKFPESYDGKKEENFDNWEANVNTYVYLQHIVPEEQVLITFQALKDEAANFTRSLARATQCKNNMVTYYKITPHARR
ncbi:hypothetical protein CBR_g31315 [Chara braunii]|uniref:Uncharacterized protein n=1 Tax=Chara braunii TaxID=69332 RepID=A0A388LEP4_CHABU|nr:hypothetical protein CBR_g31315 [Chara braunii]|eukprot:GBG80761.1 hypothetical protein CBR_g31315 [Chara braunii]